MFTRIIFELDIEIIIYCGLRNVAVWSNFEDNSHSHYRYIRQRFIKTLIINSLLTYTNFEFYFTMKIS